MTSTAYRLGADFERRVRDHLTGDGNSRSIRAGGRSGRSGSYEAIDMLRLEPPFQALTHPLNGEKAPIAPAPDGRLADPEALRRLQRAQPAHLSLSKIP